MIVEVDAADFRQLMKRSVRSVTPELDFEIHGNVMLGDVCIAFIYSSVARVVESLAVVSSHRSPVKVSERRYGKSNLQRFQRTFFIFTSDVVLATGDVLVYVFFFSRNVAVFGFSSRARVLPRPRRVGYDPERHPDDSQARRW
jgi:hypothetical protein